MTPKEIIADAIVAKEPSTEVIANGMTKRYLGYEEIDGDGDRVATPSQRWR